MGRNNYAILGMGLGSMLILSVLMSYFLKTAHKHVRSPVAEHLTTNFGERLDAKSRVKLKQSPGNGQQAEVTIYPVLGAGHERLAHEVGGFVWRRFGDELGLSSVEVICERWGRDEPLRYIIPAPYMRNRTPGAPGSKSGAEQPRFPNGMGNPGTAGAKGKAKAAQKAPTTPKPSKGGGGSKASKSAGGSKGPPAKDAKTKPSTPGARPPSKPPSTPQRSRI